MISQYGHTQCLTVLLEKHPKLVTRNKDGASPMDVAYNKEILAVSVNLKCSFISQPDRSFKTTSTASKISSLLNRVRRSTQPHRGVVAKILITMLTPKTEPLQKYPTRSPSPTVSLPKRNYVKSGGHPPKKLRLLSYINNKKRRLLLCE